MSFIDVVYKLNDQSHHDNQELRYSLRSLSNFTHLRNVYIVGFKPDWVKNVIYIPMDDHYTLKNKDANIINKMIVASTQRDISEWFINISDDQIFLKETSAAYFTIPVYNNNILTSENHYLANNYFYQRLKRTVDILAERKLPHNCYETHAPYLLNKYDYPRSVMQYDYQHGLGLCGNTLYFNTIREAGQPKQGINHCYRLQKKEDKITEDINKFQFLNFNNNTETPELFDFLQDKFPKKSNYEL